MAEAALSRSPARGGLAPNVVGACWMLASAVAFSVMASLVKYTGQVFLRLTSVFGDHHRKVDTVYVELKGLTQETGRK